MSLTGSNNEEKIWHYLKSKGFNDYACSGIMGNIFAESSLMPKNLQNTYEKKLGYSDEEYCTAVDNGTYINFERDCAGWGICQWTFHTRKKSLYEFAKSKNKSIGDLETQLDFIMIELEKDFLNVLNSLKNATSIRQASNSFLFGYENPADKSLAVQDKRTSYGQKYYDKYASKTTQKTQTTGDKNMTEKELRNKLVSIAESFNGCKESDGSHKKIIDIYNDNLPYGYYRMSYIDPWCATYVSAVGIKAGLSDIVFIECGCERMINLYKNAGRFVEDDSYVPKEADIIFYDWDDNGIGNNVGFSDHVGIVVSVNGNTMKIIEGNMNNAVGYRTLQINAKYIRGFGIPDFAKVAKNSSTSNSGTESSSNTSSQSSLKFKIGDTVKFIGNKHYVSSDSIFPSKCKSGEAKITAVSNGAKHPYHVIAIKESGSTVYGWVNASDIVPKITYNTGNVKVDYAQKFSASLSGTYKTTDNLNMRSGAGTSKDVLTVIPKGDTVSCYGYYTPVKGVKWYYVSYKDKNGKDFIGFVSSKYLNK